METTILHKGHRNCSSLGALGAVRFSPSIVYLTQQVPYFSALAPSRKLSAFCSDSDEPSLRGSSGVGGAYLQ